MVRIAVAFALVAAVDGARSNIKVSDADIATEEAVATLEDDDFDYEAADALDWDEELATGGFNFEASIEADDESDEAQYGNWQCRPGQGGMSASTQRLPYNSFQACSAACANDYNCDAFDFTNRQQNDACRFYRTGTNVRNNPGNHNRQYCSHSANWMARNPNWHGSWKNSHPDYHAPQPAQSYGGQSGSFFVADGCRRSQRNEEPQIRNSVNGFASVRCCSNNGRRCESTSVGCLQHQTLAQATAACSRRNMRLCSVQELDAGVCCGTGCGFDGHHIWTMTPAGGGFVGQNGHGQWQNNGQYNGQHNGQYNGQQGFSGSHFNGGGYHNQVSDFKVVDGCARNQGRQNTRSRSASTGRSSVRCCSMDGRRCETQTVGCLEGQTYNEATAACSRRGLRLCSEDELERGVCCGTGCGFDGRRVWTNTPSNAGGFQGSR